MKTKSLDFAIKAVDEDAGTVTLYAAVFNNVDRSDEIIAPGAFANLSAFVKDGWLAFGHDWQALAVATVEAAEQDSYGLKLLCKWHSTAFAQECRKTVKERLERGKAVKCSIGYREIETSAETRDGNPVRVLKKIELYEASIVNAPCNPMAEVTGVKGVAPWWRDYERAMRALKEGRTLSTRNRGRLARMGERLREAADDLTALLSETEQPPKEPQPEDDSAKRMRLRLRAIKGRAQLGR